MTTLRATVDASRGIARYVRFAELGEAAALLARALPLDRSATFPPALRRAGHWLRLVSWDRAITNPEGTAVLVVRRTPWVAAGAAAAGAAVLAPRSSRWQRRLLGVLAGAAVLCAGRIRDELALRRRLHDVAPGGLLIGDLVASSPGTALPWIRALLAELDAASHDATFVAILPGARRDSARARIYTRQLGFEIAGSVRSRGSTLTVLVRRPGGARPSPPGVS